MIADLQRMPVQKRSAVNWFTPLRLDLQDLQPSVRNANEQTPLMFLQHARH